MQQLESKMELAKESQHLFELHASLKQFKQDKRKDSQKSDFIITQS